MSTTTTETWYKRAGIAGAAIAGAALVGSIFWAIGTSWANSWVEAHIAPVRTTVAQAETRLDGHDARINAQFTSLMGTQTRMSNLESAVGGKLDGLHDDLADVKALAKSTRDLLEHFLHEPPKPASAALSVPVKAQD